MKSFSNRDKKVRSFEDYFITLKDPRRISKGNLKYPLPEILFLTLCAVVSGCNTWELVASFGEEKVDWLRKFFPYKNGFPSHDTLGAVYSALDVKKFGECFIEFTRSLATLDSEVVAIDGKTVRGAGSNCRNGSLHILSAFCERNRVCLGQEVVEDKSNEITAIPKLLEMMYLKNSIVTIDAMGCQKEIARKIVEKQADYILQVKDNQPELAEQVKKLFTIQVPISQSTENDMGHGRIEERTCKVIDDLRFLDGKEEWKSISTIVEINAKTIDKKTGEEAVGKRYYISSLPADSLRIAAAIRSHWSIENNLHWVLDVVFKEDNQLKRKGHSSQNFNMIAKVALGLLQAENTVKKSNPVKRFKASMSDSYRELVLKL